MRPRVHIALWTSLTEADVLARERLRVRLLNAANKPAIKALLRLVDVPEVLHLEAEGLDEESGAPRHRLLVEIDPSGGVEHGNGKILADVLPSLYSSSEDVTLIVHRFQRSGEVFRADLLGYEP